MHADKGDAKTGSFTES
jgi:hypothetical protein